MKLRLLSVILLIILISPSCHKQNTAIPYNDIVNTSNDYVIVNYSTIMILNTYFKAINDSVLFTVGSNKIDGAQTTLSNDSTEITFNYNTRGHIDSYGNWRTGSYTAITGSSFFDDGSQIRINFQNLTFNLDTITTAGIIITNKGYDQNRNKLYHIETENITRYLYDTSGSINYNFNQDIIYIHEGNSRYYSNTDLIKTTGTFGGTSVNSNAFSGVIDSAIMTRYNCRWINGGDVSVITPEFDYNSTCHFNNDCRKVFVVEINDINFERGY